MATSGQAWRFHRLLAESVRVTGIKHHWGSEVAEVLVPSTGSLLASDPEILSPVGGRPWVDEEVRWRAAAGRVIHLMAQRDPLTLGRFDIQLLPHQLEALDRALSLDKVRLLLADEVGLGKTIEAGLIFSEMIARGRIERILVVAPKGVQLQWVAEMSDRFDLSFARVGPEGMPVDAGVDPWTSFNQVICSIDSIKPLQRRSGWSPERVMQHNQDRWKAVISAGWDLVVFDEAHHVAGSFEGVARHQLAQDLAKATPHVLLLSATPHSGKTESFVRLLSLLDGSFASGQAIDRSTVSPLVVRTEKRAAVDGDGKPLFQPRTTSLEVVPYGERVLERRLYEAVSDYVRMGYNRARREKRPGIGFLLLLFQRLVSSSTAAILSALERRASALIAHGEQVALFPEGSERWGELTGEEQFDELERARGSAWGDERSEVDILLDLARKTASEGLDAKATYLLDLMRRQQRDENDPSLKFVIFTEFVPTQQMLLSVMDDVGISATSISGSMSIEDRRFAQEEFWGEKQVLISTDAGGEGINLQVAHLVINYDMPWNPMRIEQRIGRVDRIGQTAPVKAFNLTMENSVDARVLEVLKRKLWTILKELGADKWDDVLQSANDRVGEMYAEAILKPAEVEETVERIASETAVEVKSSRGLGGLLSDGEIAPRAYSRTASKVMETAVLACVATKGKSLSDDRNAYLQLPESVPGESLPTVEWEQSGVWTLWEVNPSSDGYLRDCFALFIDEQGNVRPDLSDRMWRFLMENQIVATAPPLSDDQWAKVWKLGEDHGYGACIGLAPREEWSSPRLTLRLIVRSEA